jgi:hypothetical protein
MQLDVMAERLGSVVKGRVDLAGRRVQERRKPAPLEIFARLLEVFRRDDVCRVMELWRCERKP